MADNRHLNNLEFTEYIVPPTGDQLEDCRAFLQILLSNERTFSVRVDCHQKNMGKTNISMSRDDLAQVVKTES